jgi:hypothetical protein
MIFSAVNAFSLIESQRDILSSVTRTLEKVRIDAY